VRRAIISAIVLSMAVLAPTPVSVCALFSFQIAKCETAKTQCDEMDMERNVQDDASYLSPSCHLGVACCIVSQTPRPEAQYKSNETLVPIARVSVNAEANTLFIPKESIPVFQWQDLSPPSFQSLLCTFLI
jgi:hypothetical protein